MKIKGNIQMIKCGGCVDTVLKVLQQIHGVKNPIVDLSSKDVTLEYEDPQVLDAVKEALIKAIYPIVFSV